MSVTADSGLITADSGCVTADGLDACVIVTPTPDAGGGWFDDDITERARKDGNKRKRQIWRSIEQTIEEAYADATGQPRKAIQAEVRQALAPRDPARVEAIARQLTKSNDPAASALLDKIEAQLSELQAVSVIYERMQEPDDEEAMSVILMVI